MSSIISSNQALQLRFFTYLGRHHAQPHSPGGLVTSLDVAGRSTPTKLAKLPVVTALLRAAMASESTHHLTAKVIGASLFFSTNHFLRKAEIVLKSCSSPWSLVLRLAITFLRPEVKFDFTFTIVTQALPSLFSIVTQALPSLFSIVTQALPSLFSIVTKALHSLNFNEW